jgi:hypothetical protein
MTRFYDLTMRTRTLFAHTYSNVPGSIHWRRKKMVRSIPELAFFSPPSHLPISNVNHNILHPITRCLLASREPACELT